MEKAMTVVFVTYFYVKPSNSSGAKILQTIYVRRKMAAAQLRVKSIYESYTLKRRLRRTAVPGCGETACWPSI